MLHNYSWQPYDLESTEYEGKYVTHDWINKNEINEILDRDDCRLERGEHELSCNGETMSVRLDVRRDWAAFRYDETFEQLFGDQDFDEVLKHFMPPDVWRADSEYEL